MATLQVTASGHVLVSGVALDRPHPQVWLLTASGHVKTYGDANGYTPFPAGAFDDFAFQATATDPDPVMTHWGGGTGAINTNAGANAWVRPYVTVTVPRAYPVSTGNLWNDAAYAAVGLTFYGVTTNKQQMLDAAQLELAAFGTTTPTAYQPARQSQIVIYPDRLNYCTNPSFEVSAANWSTLGTHAASITLSQDATTSYSTAGTHALKVALAVGISPRTPVTVGTTNLVLNPNGDLGDDYAPYGAETVHTVISTDFIEGTHSIQINTQAVADAQGFHTSMSALMAVTPGDTYTFSAYLKKLTGSASPTVNITWLLDPVTSTGVSESTVVPTGSWARYSVTGTAPANTTYAWVSVYYAAGTGTGNQLNVGGMQFEQQSSATPYVLGTRVADYGANNLPWQGTQHTVTGLIPGEHYVAYARVKLDTGCPRVMPVVTAGSPGVTFPDTGVTVGAGTDTSGYVDSSWYLIYAAFVATTTSATVGFAADQDGMNGSAVNFWVDAVVVENGDLPGLYFDGGFGTDYLWEQGGTTGLARSYYYADKAKKNGIVTLLLEQYTIAGANVSAPQYGVPKIT